MGRCCYAGNDLFLYRPFVHSELFVEEIKIRHGNDTINGLRRSIVHIFPIHLLAVMRCLYNGADAAGVAIG